MGRNLGPSEVRQSDLLSGPVNLRCFPPRPRTETPNTVIFKPVGFPSPRLQARDDQWANKNAEICTSILLYTHSVAPHQVVAVAADGGPVLFVLAVNTFTHKVSSCSHHHVRRGTVNSHTVLQVTLREMASWGTANRLDSKQRERGKQTVR